jgi:hypothetical protein
MADSPGVLSCSLYGQEFDMSGHAEQTNEWLHIYQNWFRMPQQFLPGTHFTEIMTAAARAYGEAQTGYVLAVTSANAKLLEAVFDRGAAAADQHAAPETVKPARVRA